MFGLVLGIVTAAVYCMSRPIEVVDETPQVIEDGRHEIDIVSRDIITHNEKTITEVRIIRETIGKNVAALTPDELVLSVDEFIGRWREYADKSPASSSGMDGPD
jgi:archaellum component FlaC